MAKLKSNNNNSANPLEGGLVLKKYDIEQILNTPETVGVAFGVYQPGSAPNVNLRVYRVTEGVNRLIGEEIPIQFKKGAANLSAPSTPYEDYVFQYRNKLESDGFDFAYLRKSEFESLYEYGGNEEEVFISGVKENYGNLTNVVGKWFTLSISPRPENTSGQESSGELKDLSYPFRNVIMDGCPPIWDALADNGGEGHSDMKRVEFERRPATSEV